MASNDSNRNTRGSFKLSARERRQMIVWGGGAAAMLASLFYLMSRLMAG